MKFHLKDRYVDLHGETEEDEVLLKEAIESNLAAYEQARVYAIGREDAVRDKYTAAKKALIAIAASKCDCGGCVMVRVIVAFMEEP